MGKKKTMDDLDAMRKVAFGGALGIKSAEVMRHTGDPTALTGDISGFAGIGIAGATSGIAMKMITGKRKQKRKRKRR